MITVFALTLVRCAGCPFTRTLEGSPFAPSVTLPLTLIRRRLASKRKLFGQSADWGYHKQRQGELAMQHPLVIRALPSLADSNGLAVDTALVEH